MIITNLIGGLGNQMFQYAVGRSLSLQKNVPLKLDVSSFRSYSNHQGYELAKIFKIMPEVATEMDIKKILSWQNSTFMRRLISQEGMEKFRRREFVVEPHYQFWAGIKDVQSNCYLSGYWQSEKYFKDVSETIKNDFSFQIPFKRENQMIADEINGVNSISLHVRRGDYVSNRKANNTHGLCTLDFYKSSIQFIVERVQNPHFFIFSDDIAWVEENINMEFPCCYVGNNKGVESYNDMRLMSLCKHHIIANSTFSWWGAWLNPSIDKTVIAPRTWFANGIKTDDLIPPNWVSL